MPGQGAFRWLLRPDRRPSDEIDAEIRDELEGHLAACADELVAEGWTREAAEREARRRFGDFDRTLTACRRVKLGDRVLLLRANLILMGLVLPALALLALGQRREALAALDDAHRAHDQARVELEASRSREARLRAEVAASAARIGASAPEPLSPEDWLARFREQPESWRHGLSTAHRLLATEGDGAADLLVGLWSELPLEHREQAMKPFLASESPAVLEVLAAAARDESASVRGRAHEYLVRFAFRDFSETPGGFEPWWERHRFLTPAAVLETCARDFVARLDLAAEPEAAKLLRQVGGPHLWVKEQFGVDLAAVLRDAGFVALCDRWLEGSSPELRERAVELLGELGLSDAELLGRLEPLLAEEELMGAAARALGRARNPLAVEPLLAAVIAGVADRSPSAWSCARALADIGDTSVIPDLIGLIVADDGYHSVYGVGYFGLSDLTGVRYDETHDGAWWREWWELNRGRLGPELAGRELPELDLDR